jgi:DNA excision repair protein ERCC-2
VRTLCEFAARRGDLDHRFTPSPTAEEGVAGHRAIARARTASYRSEVALQGDHRHLRVRGRADGVDDTREWLEEIKTFRGRVDRVPENHRHLHWAQAKVYAWLLCAQNQAPAWNVALIYFDIDRQAEAPALVERCSAAELQRHFEDLCERFLLWADRELRHRARRDAGLHSLRFAPGSLRAGQRTLAEAVFVAARRGRCLMAQAPTGIGKTMGTLFPTLKAMPEQALDKLFYLTAKGSGRAVAFDALRTLVQAPIRADCADRDVAPTPRVRVLELVAREKACEHPDLACHGESCPLARGFYDRLAAARSEAVDAEGVLDKATLREIARRHRICPYYLGQELARWCDVVVGDYNHYFDVSAPLHAMTVANGWRVAVLIDEAHNLLDRVRACYTAEMDPRRFEAARAATPAALKTPTTRLARAWNAITRESAGAFRQLPSLPGRFDKALRHWIDAVGRCLAESPQDVSPATLDFFFDALHFRRMLEAYTDRHSLIEASTSGPIGRARSKAPAPSAVCIRNVIPAPFLAPRFAAARTVVLFSATLAPERFYADTLGLPHDAAWLDVPTAYTAEQLSVRIVAPLSTRYVDRPRTIEPITRVIAGAFHRRPGNYLAFFSSFDYMEQVAAAFATRHPAVPMWQQARRMDEAARAAFVERFAVDGVGIGFAVLGGMFAEGIDLPGTRLIGAFIATLGLAQVNPVNEAVRQKMQQGFGRGFEYTYLYPGLRKVVQAAGRVLRSPADVGSIYLLDDRFCRPEVKRLLPAWWRLEVSSADPSAGA